MHNHPMAIQGYRPSMVTDQNTPICRVLRALEECRSLESYMKQAENTTLPDLVLAKPTAEQIEIANYWAASVLAWLEPDGDQIRHSSYGN